MHPFAIQRKSILIANSFLEEGKLESSWFIFPFRIESKGYHW